MPHSSMPDRIFQTQLMRGLALCPPLPKETLLSAIFAEELNGDGGTPIAGVWQARALNTTVFSNTGIVLAASQLTIDEGSWGVIASAPAWIAARHKIRLRNVTDGLTAVVGTSEYTSSNVQTKSILIGRFTVPAGGKTFELQHWFTQASLNNGLGVEGRNGEVNVYAQCAFRKYAS